MEDDDKNRVYNINFCRICQIPSNMDLIQTSCSTEGVRETYLDNLKFIFADILWVEDDLISLACASCLSKVTEVSDFKRLCLRTNHQRANLNVIFLPNLETDILKTENDALNVENIVQLESKYVDEAPTESVEIEESKVVVKTKRTKKAAKATKQQTNKKSQIDKLKEVNTIKPPHKCIICGEVFKISSLLERHIYRHNGTRNYICTVCGKKYVTQVDLGEHLKLHSGEYNYPCDICTKKFKSPSNLQTHKNFVHADPKDYKYLCTLCGKKFFGIGNFKQHVDRHKRIKNFSCVICAKSFVAKNDMKRHVLSHTNDRQFKCDLCPAEYKRNYYLLVHKSEQHNIGNHKRPKTVKKMYECSYCGKSIAFKDKFERHLRTHTGVKPYQCRRCNTKFVCKSYIKPHYKKKHDIDIDMKMIDNEAKEYYLVQDISQENNGNAVN